jgi:endonuclease/exonuclease/phosphatase family metal-dependent hydrolase
VLPLRTSPALTALRRTRALALAAVALAVSLTSLAPSTAAAADLTPAKPTAVTQAAATSDSFTVTSAVSQYATQYRVFASTTKSTLALTTIATARTSALSTTPRVTLGSLPYTTAPYYYRLQAINGTAVRYSDVYVAYLRPDTPANLRTAGRRATGLSLAWDGRPAGKYVVTQATDSALTTGVRTYSIGGQTRTFTPYDLAVGTRYWFRVRAYSGSIASANSAVVSAVAPSSGLNVRVMTYNLLHDSRAGELVGTEVIAPWSERRAGVVALAQKAGADVIGVQEANDWVGAVLGPKMVDDFAARLGAAGEFAVAHTETTPGLRGWYRTARYIVYRTSIYRAVGDGGHWTLAPGRYAAYQLLEHRTTRARFLAVSVHLEAGSGETVDLRRQAQTEQLLAFVKAYQATQDVPVVYLGDFNSHERNAVDGPGIAFRASGAADADEVAQTRVNAQYNSSNQYRRTPPATGLHIDHVFVPQGVAVRRWEMALDLVGGQFVGTIPSDHNPVVADVILPY